MNSTPTPSVPRLSASALGLCALVIATMSSSVFAGAGGLAKVTQTFTDLQTLLVGLGIVVMSMAIMWCGYKMMFQHARFGEISNVVIGGILVGGAVAFAGWFMAG
ncbi:MAG: TrbC/VirB2 family protein [Lautropia sp.]